MQLRFSRTAMVWGAGLVACVSNAQTVNWSPSINSYISVITKKDEELFKSLRSSSARRENQGVINTYYDDIRQSYLADPFSEFQMNVAASLNSYKIEINAAKDDNKITTDISKCMGSKSNQSLDDQIDAVNAALSNYGSELQDSFGSGNMDWKGASIAREQVRTQAKAFDNIFSTNFSMECCVQRVDEQSKKALPDDEATKRCTKFKTARDAAQKQFLSELKPPRPGVIPNPLDSSLGMDPDQLAVALRDAKTRRTLKNARLHGNEKDKMTEDALLSELSSCIKDAESRQNKTRPTSVMVTEALGKAVKCTLLPAIATYYFDTPWQKLTVGATAVPLQGKNWNVNCDPSEIAMWDSMRETDPMKIQQTWGIPQMANPPWIQGLRSMPPITTPFPVVGVTAEDLIRASPQYQYAPPVGTTTTTTPSDDVGSRFRTGGTSANTGRSSGSGGSISSNGSRFRTASTGTPTSLTASGTSTSRGQNLGRAFIQLTRATSSEIRRGKNVQKNSAQMASAARSTRNFFQSTRQTVSAASLSAGRKTISTAARNLVSISAGARASRTSSGEILGNIQGISRTNTGSVINTGSGTGIVSRADRTLIGQQLTAIVQTSMANIQTSITAADAIRSEMNKLIQERDNIVAKLGVEILDKAPMKIADKVMSAQQRLLNLDAQLGGLKAQWDVYETAVHEQSMFVQRALTYGPNGVNTNGLQTVNSFPDNYPAGIRGSTGSGAFFKVFDFSEAWAASMTDQATHWVKEWFRFTEEYSDYAESLVKADDKTRVQVAEFLKERDRRVEAEPMLWMDTGTLLSARMFMGELIDESEYLAGQSDQGTLNLDEVSRANILDAKTESLEALGEVSKAAQELLKAHPDKFEDNSEVWVGMLPDLLLF